MRPKHTARLAEAISNESFLNMPPSPAHQVHLDYQIVPRDPSRRKELAPDEKPWRLLVTPTGISSPPLSLELRGDVVIGCDTEADDALDVNLNEWQGYQRGVSRRHVMLRPGRNKLFIMDLRSTNGTHINGLPLGVGWAYALKDGDLITLGRLHMRVRIMQRP